MMGTSSSSSSGNTKTGASTQRTANRRSRKFFVTFWKKVDFLYDANIMQYACMCDDKCSEEHEGKWHGHYFVYYINPRTWKQIKQYFGDDCHVEIPKSNSGAINYIMGRGEHSESKSNMVEEGIAPCDNGKHISVQRALEMTRNELLALEDHKDVISVMKVRDMFDRGVKLSEWHKEVEVTWICGPSGIGKSLTAKEMLEKEGYEYAHIVKHDDNGFWDNKGVGDGYGAAIYDEFRDKDMRAREFINFIDYNRHTMNIKGGSVQNNYKRIIITSIQHPDEIYRGITGEEPRKQWLRRMNIIDLRPDSTNTNTNDLIEI